MQFGANPFSMLGYHNPMATQPAPRQQQWLGQSPQPQHPGVNPIQRPFSPPSWMGAGRRI